jgi:aryl-alcohol dehydrogenase-like predicted oxidoreductase
MSADFLHREVPSLGRSVHRLGMACNFGLEPAAMEAGIEAGLNYIFWTPRMGKITQALSAALKPNRDKLVIASGPTFGYFGGQLRTATEQILRELDTDYLDILQLFWLGKTSAWTEGTIEALLELRASGKVRKIGVSIHDRERAGRLASDSDLDMLMVRYNAAHPGAEQDIFPHIRPNKTAVVAYTATRWRKLLKRPKGWTGPVPTAADCYRFCLSNPAVDVVLHGPKNRKQLRENLEGIAKGPMTPEEITWMRELGSVVHG